MIEHDTHQLNNINYDHKDIVNFNGSRLEKASWCLQLQIRRFNLAGGTKFDFEHRKPSPSFHMTFRYSRQFWRFDLFGHETKQYDSNGILDYFFEPRTEEDNESKMLGIPQEEEIFMWT